MAQNRYIPTRDGDFKEFSLKLVGVVKANLTAYGITLAQSDKLELKINDFVVKYGAHLTAKDAAQSATADKNDSRTLAEKDLREVAQIIQNFPEITPALLEAAGLPVHDTTPTPITPVSPESLEAYGDDNGENHLEWKAGDNKPGTIYVIEAKIDPNPEFALVDVVTKTKYIHKGQTPGVRVSYRVKAKRGDLISSPSNVAVVYES